MERGEGKSKERYVTGEPPSETSRHQAPNCWKLTFDSPSLFFFFFFYFFFFSMYPFLATRLSFVFSLFNEYNPPFSFLPLLMQHKTLRSYRVRAR